MPCFGDLNETNAFTLANELLSRNIDSAGAPEVDYWPSGGTPAYSKAGELLDDKVNYTYVYDAWGRLRQVKNRSTSAVVSEYRYNALGYRIAWHYDVTSASSPFGPDGSVNDTDPWYFFAYNERWQKWGVIRGTSSSGTITLDANPKEIFVHHKAGAGGFGGSSYIDSVLLRERDTSAEWRLAPGLTLCASSGPGTHHFGAKWAWRSRLTCCRFASASAMALGICCGLTEPSRHSLPEKIGSLPMCRWMSFACGQAMPVMRTRTVVGSSWVWRGGGRRVASRGGLLGEREGGGEHRSSKMIGGTGCPLPLWGS